MRILLINPVVALNRTELGFPLTLIYLGSVFKNLSGYDVELLDLTLERLLRGGGGSDLLGIQEKIVADFWHASGPFDLVGITGLCDNFHFTIRLAGFIKRKFGAPVVLGGPHATFVSESILKEFPFVDFVVKHEGSLPLLKLCEALSGKGEIGSVPNLAYRCGGGIRNTEISGASSVIEGIIPLYDLLPVKEYFKLNVNLAMPVLAGTGCPFACSYCVTSLMWHRRYEIFPAAHIAGIIARLKAVHDIPRFTLIHDNLLFRRDKMAELCGEMRKLGVLWSCSSRIEHIAGDEELISRLADTGCKGIFIGLETASKSIQKSIGKNINAFSALPVLKTLVSKGIKPTFSFILGFPEETDADKNETIKLAFSLKVNGAERININHLVPLPGSRIITGKLKFLRAKREFSVPGLLDTRQIRFIEKYKSVFISQWFVPGCRSNSRFRPSITKRLHEYCAVHYRAFNYLFSEAGISPSSLFACIRRGICFRGLSREVRRLAGPKRYLVFREIYKYERGLKRLVDRHPGRIPERGDTSPLDITAKYSLSDRVELLSTTAAVYGFMSVGKKEAGADRDGRFFLCLADTGPRIETYKVSRGCYSVFRALSGNSPKLLQNIPGMRSGEKREALVNALEKLNSIGGLIRG